MKKAMWLYPKVLGFNPSDRWGHSACCYNGVVYIFGGCCGGLHFSDVLTLDLDTMTWNTFLTTGQRPGARDSHGSVVLGDRMIVFGGTNGSEKVNDLHVLDLRTKEWSRPKCDGIPPAPRESHTATVVDDNKLVIFGGSGEGEANYLNDLHVLDLSTMSWTSPEVKGELPAPRDSHVAAAIGNKLFVYGGDCGDRYQGEVNVLDMDTLWWSRLIVQGSSPGVRAGHAAVSIGTKVFIIGGVGDKLYYNDVWVLDVSTCSWSELAARGQQPQGRFSHIAVLTGSDIAIYGGCGDDERPLNELLILQLGAEHPNGRYNISLCKTFGNHCHPDKQKFPRKNDTNLEFGNNRARNLIISEPVSKQCYLKTSDNLTSKKKRTIDSQSLDIESEQEEHSLSLSQNSSPSQSDQDQTPIQKISSSALKPVAASRPCSMLRQPHLHSNDIVLNQPENAKIRRGSRGVYFMGGENRRHLAPRQLIHQEGQYMVAAPDPLGPAGIQPLIGAEVRGTVDGAFDSGYLMTANVNGRILRGVLFAPGHGFASRAALPPTATPVVTQQPLRANCNGPTCVRSSQQPITLTSEYNRCLSKTQSSLERSSSGLNNDLKGIILTLGSGHGGS